MHLDNFVNQINSNLEKKPLIEFFFQNTWPSCLDLLSSFGEFDDMKTSEIGDKLKLVLQNEKVKEDSMLKLEIEI